MFSKQGYPDKTIQNEMKKVNLVESRRKTKSALEVPFVVACNPRLKVLVKIIHEKVNLLYMNDRVNDTFTPEPMVSVRAAQKPVFLLESNYAHYKKP